MHFDSSERVVFVSCIRSISLSSKRTLKSARIQPTLPFFLMVLRASHLYCQWCLSPMIVISKWLYTNCS